MTGLTICFTETARTSSGERKLNSTLVTSEATGLVTFMAGKAQQLRQRRRGTNRSRSTYDMKKKKKKIGPQATNHASHVMLFFSERIWMQMQNQAIYKKKNV